LSYLAFSRWFAESGGGDAFSGLGINGFLIIFQLVNILLLILFLNSLLIKPLLRGLDNRRKRIEDSLANAAKADERLANVEKDYQAKMAEAEVAAAKVRADALQGVQAEIDRLRKEALADVDRIREQARVDALAERNQTLAQMRTQVAGLAMAAANAVIGESLDARRQQALINDFFAKVPAALASDVKVASAGAAAVTVTSALPLTDDEQSRARADLARQLGSIASVAFEVDPAIMGGLIVRVGDKVIDGSVAARLTSLKQQVGA
jgi:F-type H+-transporting ATPase subunit b